MCEKKLSAEERAQLREQIEQLRKYAEALEKDANESIECVTKKLEEKYGKEELCGTVFDYKKDKDFCHANGIKPKTRYGESVLEGAEVCRGVTFRNFFHLCAEDVVFEDCIFENCHQVTAENGQMNGCTFTNVDNVEGIRSDFRDCNFRDCCSTGPFLIIDSHGSVKGCNFDNITALGDDGYVVYSLYEKRSLLEIMTDCKFVDCRADSEDGKMCYCAYFKPFSSYRTLDFDNVDYTTCDFDGAEESV